MKRAAPIALAPLSLMYGAAVNIRSALYRNGIFKRQTVGVPVISVGNITTGGTGKTPLVEWIARRLAERGDRVCVLTRGYRRANPAERVVVSDGKRIVADIEQSGDEAMMLARFLIGKAAVVCDANRVAGARWAIENLNPDVLILDDGFQHLRIARDLDVVTVDATNPRGNGRLLPAGILREPIGSLRRADCIIVTRSSEAIESGLQKRITQATAAPIFRSTTVISRITPLESPELEQIARLFGSRPSPHSAASVTPRPSSNNSARKGSICGTPKFFVTITSTRKQTSIVSRSEPPMPARTPYSQPQKMRSSLGRCASRFPATSSRSKCSSRKLTDLSP